MTPFFAVEYAAWLLLPAALLFYYVWYQAIRILLDSFLYKNGKAVNFSSKQTALSVMLIQFFLLLPYRLLSGVVFEAGNEWVLWLMVWVAGTSWIYFVATNADQMWKAEKQIKYLLLPAIIGCLPLLADGCRILAEHFVLR